MLLDSGSTLSLIDSSTVKSLGLVGKHVKLHLTVVGGGNLASNEQEIDLQLQSLDGHFTTPPFIAVTKRGVTAPVAAVRINPSEYAELEGAKFTESYPQVRDSHIDLIVDEDVFLYLLDGECVNNEELNTLKIIPTLLGDVLGGAIPTDLHEGQTCHAYSAVQVPNYESFMGLEDLGITEKETSTLSLEDEEAVALMEKLTSYDAKRKEYTTGLLFKDDPKKCLDSNYLPAKMITMSAKRRSIQHGKAEQVNAAYLEQVSAGFAEVVPQNEQFPTHPTYCIPTHPVYKPSSLTTKTRIVFNASSKCRTTGKSLNDILYQGPTLLPDLVHILLKFRTFKYVSAADISKMFWKIRINLPDKDCLRFTWQWDAAEPVTLYRANCVTFGVISAPFQAIWTVLHHCDRFQAEFPLAAASIKSSLYMDDVSNLADEYEDAVETARQVYQLFLLANMQPHKWNTNKTEVLRDAGVPEKYWATVRQHKVLGVQWDTLEDTIEFDFSNILDKEPAVQTKRLLIQQAARIFDPLGLIAPFTLKAKLLFQQCWLEKIDWDDPLTPEIAVQWEAWRSQVADLEKIQQPRLIASKIKAKPWLAVMSDASGYAYGACVYYVHGESSKLLFSKTRVAPLKQTKATANSVELTIARLELLAAMIATRVATYVRKGFPDGHFSKTCFFTDSLITLWRIRRGPKSYKMWVANRLKEIRSKSEVEDWFFCPGTLNSADLSSRSTTASELLTNELWWEGPAFLKRAPEHWPEHKALSHQEALEQNEIDRFEQSQQKAGQINALNFPKKLLIKGLFDQTSSWPRLQKTTSWFVKFLLLKCPSARKYFRIFRELPQGSETINYVTVAETKVADLFWIRLAQQLTWSNELEWVKTRLHIRESAKFMQLQPYVGADNILRSVSRLVLSEILPSETTKPIMLPRHAPIIEKYVLHLHKMLGHTGPSQTMYFIRRQFRLIGGKCELRRILHMCTTRNCNKPIPLSQRIAPLPSFRIDHYTPWDQVACDFFGPIGVKHVCAIKDCPHPATAKSWGAIFTCMQTRAVHLELVLDMSTATFLRALMRLISRRGAPSFIWSDNAKTFKSAQKQLQRLYNDIDWEEVREACAKKSITWEFGISKAPHSNGVVERMVKTTKEALKVTLASASLPPDQLQTVLCEAEAVVNDRPLAAVAESEDSELTITPAMLCIGRNISALPFDHTNSQVDDQFTRMWAYRKTLLMQFWKRWRRDYLLSNELSRFQSNNSPSLEKNQVVLLNEKNLAKGKWCLARVLDVTIGRDGRIRRVKLRTKSGELERHINQIALLEGSPFKGQQLRH